MAKHVIDLFIDDFIEDFNIIPSAMRILITIHVYFSP